MDSVNPFMHLYHGLADADLQKCYQSLVEKLNSSMAPASVSHTTIEAPTPVTSQPFLSMPPIRAPSTWNTSLAAAKAPPTEVQKKQLSVRRDVTILQQDKSRLSYFSVCSSRGCECAYYPPKNSKETVRPTNISHTALLVYGYSLTDEENATDDGKAPYEVVREKIIADLNSIGIRNTSIFAKASDHNKDVYQANVSFLYDKDKAHKFAAKAQKMFRNNGHFASFLRVSKKKDTAEGEKKEEKEEEEQEEDQQ